MNRFLIVLALVAIAGVAGCAAPRQAYYAAQQDYRTQVSAQNAAKQAAVQASAAGCSDDTCRVAVAAIAALTQGERIAAPGQYRSEGGSVLNLVGQALNVGASVYGQKLQADSLVDLAGVIAGSAGDRSNHFDYSDHSDNSTHIADSFNDSSDNSAHGDTISDSGNTSIADSYNGNAGRDLIGGDRVDNNGNIGTDNRQDSPGPIDDHSDDGDDCSGESCNPTENPVP